MAVVGGVLVDPKDRLSCKVAHMTEWRVNQHEHPAGDKKHGRNGS